MAHYVATRESVLSRQPAVIGKALHVGSGVDTILNQAKKEGRKALSEAQAKSLFKFWGLCVPRGNLARTASEARSLADGIGGPVAMKASSPDLLHKTEAGVIRLGVNGSEEVERAFEEILDKAKKWNPQARLDGVLVEEMIGREAREVIVGARQDLRFGPVVTFGLGGILVEAIKDFAVWPAPLTLEEAHEMIQKIRGYRILTAFRGRPPADLEALAQVICQVGQLACQWREEIAELEINPLFVLPRGSGAIVGDALVVMR
jgi:acetyltransferase